jgi:hypothetical protein
MMPPTMCRKLGYWDSSDSGDLALATRAPDPPRLRSGKFDSQTGMGHTLASLGIDNAGGTQEHP